MGLLFEGVTWGNFLALIGFVGVLLLVNEVTRRSMKMSILVYVVLPVILAVLVTMGILGSPTGKTWFGWVKVISALIGVYGFLLIRFSNLGNRKFAAIFPVTILSLNIAEAVYREFQVYTTYTELVVDPAGSMILGGTWNLFNGVAGILTILTLAGFSGIRVSKDQSRDMIWPDMTWMYIVGYTLWNFAYVYNCISVRSMYAGLAILLAALLGEVFFKQGAWLQHRAQILSFYAMFSLSFDYQASQMFQIYPTYDTRMLMFISVVAFVFNACVFAYMIYTMVKRQKNPLKEEVFSHTGYYLKSVRVNNL